MKHKNLFWGLFFLLAALFVLFSQVISFGEIGVWTILATIFLAALAIQSGATRNFYGLFFSIALLYAIYQDPLDLYRISFWILMVAAACASIGCSILFHGRHWGENGSGHFSQDGVFHGPGPFQDKTQNIDDDNPSASINFGSSCRYLHSDCLKSARFSVSFGKLDVFFDQARPSPDGADIYIHCSFSGMDLYFPKEWRVTDSIREDLGSVESSIRSTPPASDAPKINLIGSVEFGKVSIHYL